MKRFILVLLLLSNLTQAAPVLYRLQLRVPLVHQTYNACGPASLVETLGYWGIDLPLAVVSVQTRPSATAYMTAQAIPAFAARYGLEARLYRGGRVDIVRALLMKGVPVIALTWLRSVGDVPHWRVISGFDDGARRLYIHDPLLGYVSITYDDFARLWNTQGTMFAVVYPATLRQQVINAVGA